MKKLFMTVFVLFLLFFSLDLNAQINQDWKWMHPFPQGNTIRWVEMLTTTNWYACGYAGTFMKTTNAGVTWSVYTNAGGWQSSYYGQGRILYSGWFFNANTGLVCGSSGWIARTTNAGLNWDSLASPTASTLYGMHFVNNNVGYAGGASGTILKTVNGGLNWTALTSGVTTTIYNIFASDSLHVFAPTTSGNVRVSTDAGATWNARATGTSFTVYDANFINANTGMVCGSSGNIKLTTNGGLNWTSANSAYTSTLYELFSSSTVTPPSTPYSEDFTGTTFPPTGWKTVNVAGSVVWVRSTTQFHSTPASAFINYDCSGLSQDWLITPQWTIAAGDSLSFWIRTNDSGFPPDSLCVRVSTTDTALASFTTRILYLAEGVNYPPSSTWARYSVSLNAFAGQNIYIGFKHVDNCGDGIFLDDVAVNRQAGTATDFYVVGDPSNVYKSTNLGTNWTALTYNDPNQDWTSTYYTVDVNGTSIVTGGASGLIMRSTNGGTNWTCMHEWLSPGTKYDVWAQYNNGKVIVVGAPGSAGATFDQVLLSTNGGTSWTSPPVNSNATFYSLQMLNATTGFMCGSSGNLRKTTNGGLNWDSVGGAFGTNLLRRIEFVNATTGYLFQSTTNSGGAWKTTDGGANWTAISMGTNDSRIYYSCFINANTGYVGNYTPKLMKTTDGGANWTLLANTPMGSGYIYGIHFFGANSGIVCGSSAARIARTTDGGTTFDTVPQPFAAGIYSSKFWEITNGWVFGYNGYAGRTTNGGTTWSIYNTSGSYGYGNYFTASDSGFVVGTSGYVHKLSKSPLTGIEWTQEKIPDTYYLNQNYPNPFNPSTTIEFAIPKSGFVNLKIYDIAGREVSNAINMQLNAGVVKYMFNGANFASGVYFYKLIVDGKNIDTKKMVLIK
ncbi:MAG: choice-of-anchor J domain-containing protein [Ignavibacteria bacterium]|nr:choice-of-anchor J domain-containing protein [Ignavibacteria bacterium]